MTKIKKEILKRKASVYLWSIITIILVIIAILLIFNGNWIMSITNVINPNMGDYVSGLIGTTIGAVIGIVGAIAAGNINSYMEKNYEQENETNDSINLLFNNFNIMLENEKQCIFNEEVSRSELAKEYAECHGMLNYDRINILSLKDALNCLNKIPDKNLSNDHRQVLLEFYSNPTFFTQSVKILLEDYRYNIRSIVRKIDDSSKFINEFFEGLDYLHFFNINNELHENFFMSVEKCYLDRISSDMNLFINYYKKYKKGDVNLKEWDDLNDGKKEELEIFYQVLSHDNLLNLTTDLSGCCIFGLVNSNYLHINTLDDYKDLCKRKLLFSNYDSNFIPKNNIEFIIKKNQREKKSININNKLKEIWDENNSITNFSEFIKNSSYIFYNYNFFNNDIRKKMLDDDYIKKLKRDCSNFMYKLKDKKEFLEYIKRVQNQDEDINEILCKFITDTYNYKLTIKKVRHMLDKEELYDFIKLLIKYCDYNFIPKIVDLGYYSVRFRYLVAKQLDNVKSNFNIFEDSNKPKCHDFILCQNNKEYDIYDIHNILYNLKYPCKKNKVSLIRVVQQILRFFLN